MWVMENKGLLAGIRLAPLAGSRVNLTPPRPAWYLPRWHLGQPYSSSLRGRVELFQPPPSSFTLLRNHRVVVLRALG